MVNVHKVDYEKDMAHGADNHKLPVDHKNLADPIGVDHQIHEVGGRPADHNLQWMA